MMITVKMYNEAGKFAENKESGAPDDVLNPLAIVKFTAAYATFIRKNISTE